MHFPIIYALYPHARAARSIRTEKKEKKRKHTLLHAHTRTRIRTFSIPSSAILSLVWDIDLLCVFSRRHLLCLQCISLPSLVGQNITGRSRAFRQRLVPLYRSFSISRLVIVVTHLKDMVYLGSGRPLPATTQGDDSKHGVAEAETLGGYSSPQASCNPPAPSLPYSMLSGRL